MGSGSGNGGSGGRGEVHVDAVGYFTLAACK